MGKAIAAGAAAAVCVLALAAFVATRGAARPQLIHPNSVVVIDPASGKLLADVPVGVEPASITAGFGSVWVGNLADGTVSRIDPSAKQAPPYDLSRCAAARSRRERRRRLGRFGNIGRADQPRVRQRRLTHPARREQRSGHDSFDGHRSGGVSGFRRARASSTSTRVRVGPTIRSRPVVAGQARSPSARGPCGWRRPNKSRCSHRPHARADADSPP